MCSHGLRGTVAKASLIRHLDDELGDENKMEQGWCLVLFGAPWCAPAQQLGPILESLAKKYDGKVVFYSYNVDIFNARRLAQDIKGLPTLVLFHKKWHVEKVEGFRSADMIETMLLRHMNAGQPAAEVCLATKAV